MCETWSCSKFDGSHVFVIHVALKIFVRDSEDEEEGQRKTTEANNFWETERYFGLCCFRMLPNNT